MQNFDAEIYCKMSSWKESKTRSENNIKTVLRVVSLCGDDVHEVTWDRVGWWDLVLALLTLWVLLP
jgi:hypothetical protein